MSEVSKPNKTHFFQELLPHQHRLAETERRLRDAEMRSEAWRQRYEDAKPKWQEQIRPVMDRLQQLEHDMKQQVLASKQKQMVRASIQMRE